MLTKEEKELVVEKLRHYPPGVDKESWTSLGTRTEIRLASLRDLKEFG